ncbi:ATP-dependent nuclease [Parasphingorhabdus sp. NYA22]
MASGNPGAVHLAEIVRLAKLDLKQLREADAAENRAVVRGLLDDANDRLDKESKGLWSQSDATLYFEFESGILDLLVRNQKDIERKFQFQNFKNRSDGYRQFVALQLFTFLKKVNGAILLIDEIDQHLHYDAQADLVQILQREPSIGNVIYTTHSAGALPEDIGCGVKLVSWHPESKKRSVVINKFWQHADSDGFRPLLFGMGASTMAFFPTRKALLGEGPTELLLLPKMFGEVLGRESLDFQVVPGLASINPSGLPMLDKLIEGVAFIVDNDKAGRDKADDLENAGVPRANISSVSMGRVKGPITIEDLLEPEVWKNAVNQHIATFGKDMGVTEKITEVPEFGRIQALPKPIRKSKISFAYNIIDQLNRDPSSNIVWRKRKDLVTRIATKIMTALELIPDTQSETD